MRGEKEKVGWKCGKSSGKDEDDLSKKERGKATSEKSGLCKGVV